MRIIDADKQARVVDNQEMRNIARQGIIQERPDHGFWAKLFGLTPVRIIDGHIVAQIKNGKTTFYIRLYYKQMRLFGEVSFSAYSKTCFPGGDEHPEYFDDREEAIDRLLIIADREKFIPGKGGIFL